MPQRFRIEAFEIDPEGLRIQGPEGAVKVEYKVMQVLLALSEQPGQVVSRRALEDRVWAGRVISEDVVTNAIAKLRKAFGDSARSPRFIETVPKRGYRLLQTPRRPEARIALQADPAPARPRGVALAMLLLAAIASAVYLLAATTSKDIPATSGEAVSLAVLPFVSDEAAGAASPIVSSMARELTTMLSRQPGLTVISARSAAGFSGPQNDLGEIARALGVRFLVDGSVDRRGDDFHVQARLVDSTTGAILWSERHESSAVEIIELQQHVAMHVVAALTGRTPAEREIRAADRTLRSLAAYEAFLRGRSHYGRVTPADNQAAIGHFEHAITLDPSFARAHAALALAWARPVMDGWTDDAEHALEHAREALHRAEQLDPALPQVHFVRAMIALFEGRHAIAAQATYEATRLDPNYADAYGLRAWILAYGGRPDQAAEALATARRLNPLSGAAYSQVAGEIAFARGRYAEAVAAFEETLMRNPTHARARLWLAASLSQLGRQDAANWELEELRMLNPGLSIARIGFGFPHRDPDLQRRFNAALLRVGMPR